MRGAFARWRHRRLQRSLMGPRLLAAFAEHYPGARFAEVGANDGVKHDHLRRFIADGNWTGVMVEPVPYVFARLAASYAENDRVVLENVAVADRDGSLSFFHLRESADPAAEGLPEWYDGIGSFSREFVLGHAATIPDVADRLVETAVPTLTFTSLLERHGLTTLDLLLTDTEGHDWEIIRTIDLERCRPRLIVYEHFHLPPDDRAACAAHLREAGYETREEGFDTFALRSDDDALTGIWRGLSPAVPGSSVHDR